MDPDVETAARNSLTEEAFKRCQKEGFGWMTDTEWSVIQDEAVRIARERQEQEDEE